MAVWGRCQAEDEDGLADGLATEQYKEIIQTTKEGFCGCRPNERIATALVPEGNLGYQGISTHSFRKWYATEIYKNNGYDIALVQRLLRRSNAAVTQRYIGHRDAQGEDQSRPTAIRRFSAAVSG